MNGTTVNFREWLANAEAMAKAAADAATEIKDPTDKGTPSITSHPDGNNRSALNLPTNLNNMSEPDKMHNICDVTKPNGVGQGEYIKPENGNAKDEAFTSPTVALDKIAAKLQEGLKDLQKSAFDQTPVAPVETPSPAPAPAAEPAAEALNKVASPEAPFQMPSNLNDPSLLEKLASCTAIMMGTTEGQAAVAEALERHAGMEEAAALITDVQESMFKEAMAAQMYEQQRARQHAYEQEMAKQASVQPTAAQMGHAALLNSLQFPFEKQAYEQGVADAEAMAGSMEGDGPATIPGAEGVSDEDVLAAIQELVATGQIDQADAEALLAQASQDGEVTLQEIVELITAAVQSGEITPEDADAIAQQLLEAEGAVAEPAAQGGADPAAAAAEADIAKTASILNSLFGNPAQA